MVDFVNTISDSRYLICSTLFTPKLLPQLVFQHVLEDGAGDGNADSTTSRAERVRGRSDDSLMLVVDGGDEAEERRC